jgi:formate C-acetyltransferase
MLTPPALCVETGFLITESYKETEGMPPVIRRAKALEKVLKERTIFVDSEEIIVGSTTSKRRGVILFPEVQREWCLRDIDNLSTRNWDRLAPLTEDEKIKMKEFLPYWRGKSTYDKWLATIPEAVKKLQFSNIFVTNTSSTSGVHLAHTTADFEKVLTLGLNGIKEEVKDEIDKLSLAKMEDFEKFTFLTAINIALDAVINFAKRYAKLAKSLSEKESDFKRKKELEMIAEACNWVPASPPRSFYEALQTVWFILIALRIEGIGPGIGPGRADQYLYPFYRKDIEEGKITKEEARELISLFLIKLNDVAITLSTEFVQQLTGFPTIANITLGGVTKSGRNAVNELSYLFLDAAKDTALPADEIVIRISRETPDDFLIKAVEVNKELRGKFKFISDETTIKMLLNEGYPIEYARDYILVGCFTPTVPAYSFRMTASMVNLAIALELALNNGVSRLTKEKIGLETGDPRKFKSYEEVWNAYRRQLEYIISIGIVGRNIDRKIYADNIPCPFWSALMHGPIQKGIDVIAGGVAPYMSDSHGGVGQVNVADSLAAIKKLVFEDKKISMEQLINALDNNFEGYEDVLYLCKSAPKFGNDDDYVDSILNEVLTHFANEVAKYKGIVGIKQVINAGTGTAHVPFGKVVGALPDGRKAEEPLAEGGISPHQGRNASGPTATLKSVAKIDHVKISGGSVLNMRFNPNALRDDQKIRKFVSMLRTYCESGGYHVQFNIVDVETLKDAQKNPEKYRDLLVRVATYTAYFVDLSPELQNDIIARMEFGEVV